MLLSTDGGVLTFGYAQPHCVECEIVQVFAELCVVYLDDNQIVVMVFAQGFD